MIVRAFSEPTLLWFCLCFWSYWFKDLLLVPVLQTFLHLPQVLFHLISSSSIAPFASFRYSLYPCEPSCLVIVGSQRHSGPSLQLHGLSRVKLTSFTTEPWWIDCETKKSNCGTSLEPRRSGAFHFWFKNWRSGAFPAVCWSRVTDQRSRKSMLCSRSYLWDFEIWFEYQHLFIYMSLCQALYVVYTCLCLRTWFGAVKLCDKRQTGRGPPKCKRLSEQFTAQRGPLGSLAALQHLKAMKVNMTLLTDERPEKSS